MGQKVNPHGLRVGVIKDWDSKWYAEAEFADYLVEDYNIRKFLKNSPICCTWFSMWTMKAARNRKERSSVRKRKERSGR